MKNKQASPKKQEDTTIDTTRVSLPEIKPLERAQLLKIGADYLKEAKLAKKKHASLRSIPTESTVSHQYSDYLRGSIPRYNIEKDHREIQRVRNLLASNNSTKPDFKEALLIANRLEHSTDWNSERLANSIQAKLLILDRLK